MQQYTRLFDCLDYAMQGNPNHPMLYAKEGGRWHGITVKEVHESVNQLAAAFLTAGISQGDGSPEGRDKIGIISINRPEWVMVDLATQKIGAVLAPIYPTININELEFVLNDAAVKILFVHDEDLFRKVMSIKDKLPHLQHLLTFNHVPGATHWRDFITPYTPQLKPSVEEIAAAIQPDVIATIIYTSGTTGTPKGVMLSHNNIMSNIKDSSPVFDEIGIRGERALSFLPLNHIFEKMVTYIYLFNDVSIYYAQSMDTIGENLKEVKPAIFSTVPRLLEKVYERIMGKASELTGVKRKLFFWALSLAEEFDVPNKKGAWYNFQLGIANKIIFSKWREALGDNVKCIVTGAAACQPRLLRIFTAAQVPILEGYGLTETSPVISVNRISEEGRRFGTVGNVIRNLDVRLAEDGEILCKGSNVMMGYYKRPDLTAEVIKDGYFHTGDIGIWQEERFLKITDRKKEIFKTSGGKYVAPQPIENKIKESPYVEQLIVVGPERKFAGALIVPSFNNLEDWCKHNGVSFTTKEEVIRDPKVLGFYRELIDKYNKNFNHVEQIKRFELLSTEWTTDGGELTPTLKLKRKVIMEKYADAIERIYS